MLLPMAVDTALSSLIAEADVIVSVQFRAPAQHGGSFVGDISGRFKNRIVSTSFSGHYNLFTQSFLKFFLARTS